MKLKLAILAIALCALAAPSVASAATTDSVTGTNVNTGAWNLGLDNIQSGPNGENPTGSVKLIYPSGPNAGTVAVSYPVICLRVEGNLAFIGLDGSPVIAGAEGLAVARDNGIATPDAPIDKWAQFWAPNGDAQSYCDNPPVVTEFAVLNNGFVRVLGDIAVTDGHAEPQNAADAKANWQAYGFKNQGQAMAWWSHNH